MTISLGVDLAAEPKNTFVCLIEWDGRTACVSALEGGIDDDELLGLFGGADRVGVDAPFGWPEEFVQAVVDHAEGRRWPGRDAAAPRDYRARLRFRETDRHVRAVAGRTALSVSSDRLAMVAMRCALLLDRAKEAGLVVDRTGQTGSFAEVYPAAALACWDLSPRSSYKGPEGHEERRRLVDDLINRASYLELGVAQREMCYTHDDALDALVSALVARATLIGKTERPEPGVIPLASREGWIHLPFPGSLGQLVADTVRDIPGLGLEPNSAADI